MFIYYGTRRLRVKKIDDYNIKCEKCGEYHQVFKIYKDCFHIFWIPFIPVGKKYISCSCGNCGDSFNEIRKADYLENSGFSLKPFFGFILLAALITAIVISVQFDNAKTKERLENPAIGDVWLIYEKIEGKRIYYFSKIFDLDKDSVYFLLNAYEYDGKASELDQRDFFVNDVGYSASRDTLMILYNDGTIKKVFRDYGENSTFNHEKSSDEIKQY